MFSPKRPAPSSAAVTGRPKPTATDTIGGSNPACSTKLQSIPIGAPSLRAVRIYKPLAIFPSALPSCVCSAGISILRHAWIDIVRPRGDAAFHVPEFAKSGFLQEPEGSRTAAAALALQNDLIRRIEFAHARRQLAQRNQARPGDAAEIVFIRFA